MKKLCVEKKEIKGKKDKEENIKVLDTDCAVSSSVAGEYITLKL